MPSPFEAQPFKIDIAEGELDDLRRRLKSARWPEAEPVDDWSQGIPLAYLQDVCAYWADEYDWRATETRINAFPQYKAQVNGLGIHFIHAPSPEPNAIPLIMTHGWPGSIMEFHKVIEPLRNPAAFGGDPADAFHVVCPSLPGYGFSDRPTETGWNVQKIANTWGELMQGLGYERYVAQGGDWGSMVTTCVGAQDAEHCAGIHLNMPIAPPHPDCMDDLTPAEQAAMAGMQHYTDNDSGYSKQQSTRPQTVGYGLVDSPVGQAGWIIEKFWSWMDCDGHPENILTRDELLDNVMMYWLPATAASSARLYWESFKTPPMADVSVPVSCSIFPKEIFRTSKRWAEKRYENLVYFNTLEKGGHFAAFEQPEVFVEEVRKGFRHAR